MTGIDPAARELERRHLLSLLVAYGPMHAASLADRANEECLNEAFDGLPDVSRRGIGQKLDALARAGLVAKAYDRRERLTLWSVTDAGRETAALDPYEPAPPLPVDGGEGRAEPTPGDFLQSDTPSGPRSFHVPFGALWDELYDAGEGTYRIGFEWFRLRWTTDAERADEDWLSLAFGDPEGVDTSVLPIPARATDRGAHLYVTLDKVEPPASSSSGDEAPPAEVFLVWGVNYPRGDEEYTLLSIHADRDEAAAVVDQCDWRGERQVAVALPEWAEVAFDSIEGPDARPVLGVRPAGDEAREALARIAAMDVDILADDRKGAQAGFFLEAQRLARAALSAPADATAMVERAAATMATLDGTVSTHEQADVFRERARLVLGFALGYGRALPAPDESAPAPRRPDIREKLRLEMIAAGVPGSRVDGLLDLAEEHGRAAREAREGQDAPAREVEWQVLGIDEGGSPELLVEPTTDRAAARDTARETNAREQRIGNPPYDRVVLQRRDRTVTEWVDVPATEEDGSHG